MAPAPVTFAPDQIAAAQWLADSLNVLGTVLILGGCWLLPVLGVIRRWTLRSTWSLSLVTIVVGGLVLDFGIVLPIHFVWPGILKQLSGDFGEQPYTPACAFVGTVWTLLIFFLGKAIIFSFRFIFLRQRPKEAS